MEILNTVKVWARNEWLYYYFNKIRTTLQKHWDDCFEATCILENLWLGSITSSCNREALHEHGIETIVSAVLGSTANYPFDFNYERAKLRDIEDEDILSEFCRLLPIIHSELLQHKGVLVNCIAGRSRSASIVAAYLIKYQRMTTDQALQFIKEKRSQIDPNPGYIRQLREFESDVNYERETKKNE